MIKEQKRMTSLPQATLMVMFLYLRTFMTENGMTILDSKPKKSTIYGNTIQMDADDPKWLDRFRAFLPSVLERMKEFKHDTFYCEILSHHDQTCNVLMFVPLVE